MVLETDSNVEQDEEGSVVDSVAEVVPVEVELSEDVIEGVRSVVGAALAEVCEALEAGLVVGSDEAELDSALEDVEEELKEEVEEEEELVEDVLSVTVCVVTMVTGAVAVTVVGDSGGTTEMSVWVTVFVVSFAVAVTVISGVAVGDDVTVWTTVVVLPCSVAAGLPPSMGTME